MRNLMALGVLVFVVAFDLIWVIDERAVGSCTTKECLNTSCYRRNADDPYCQELEQSLAICMYHTSTTGNGFKSFGTDRVKQRDATCTTAACNPQSYPAHNTGTCSMVGEGKWCGTGGPKTICCFKGPTGDPNCDHSCDRRRQAIAHRLVAMFAMR